MSAVARAHTARPRVWLALGLAMLLSGASPALSDAVRHGDRAWQAGDQAGALLAWGEALTQARAEGDLTAEHDLLLRLGALHRSLGRTQTARQAVRAAGALGLSAPVPAAQARVAEGLIDLSEGDPRAALSNFQAAWQALQAAGEPALAANAAVNLGLARRDLGDDAGAIRAFEAAIKLFGALNDPRGLADARTGLASVLRRTGRLGAARGELEQAIALWRSVGDLAGEADALTNLGLTLQDLGRPDEARHLFEASLTTARARRDLTRQGHTLLALGDLAHGRGDRPSAAAHYEAASTAFTGAGLGREAVRAALRKATTQPSPEAFEAVARQASAAHEPRVEAIARLNQASLLAPKQPAQAQQALDQARALASRYALGAVSWRVDHAEGVLARDAGKPKEAAKRMRAAVDALEQRRRALGPEDARTFVASNTRVYDDLIGVLLAMGDTKGAFLYAQRLQLAEVGGGPPPGAEEYSALAAEQAALLTALEDARLADPDGAGSERAQALSARLDEVKVAFARSVDELRAAHPDLSSLVRIEPEDLEAVQAELDPGVTVLQPVLLSDRIVLLAFRRDRLVAKEVMVPAAEVERTTHRLARILQGQAPVAPAIVEQLATQLGDWLVQPVRDLLADTEVLVLSTTGPFRQVPFAMLRVDGEPLIRRAAVVNITHVGSLRALAPGQPGFRLRPAELLLIGNPDGSLPGAEAEVKAIAARYPGSKPLIGPQGTRAALLAAAPGKRTVHLATHGVLDPDHPAASHLILAPDATSDGRLGYAEIPGLSTALSEARLVVLSACESGRALDARPEAADGQQLVVSIAGLAAQFRRAGVETLVGSLWKVDDLGTRALMDAFYAELAGGRDVARAMQQAQLQLLADPTTSHPFYWASFQVFGDWR